MDSIQRIGCIVDPVLFARDALGFRCDDWQARFLRSRASRKIGKCSRQVGKTTIESLETVHHAVFTPNALALCVSPTQRQSDEFFAKVSDHLRRIPQFVHGLDESGHRILARSATLTNGSRIVALPSNGDNLRGFSGVTRLVIDEAAFAKDTLYHAVKPMLIVSRGSLVLISSPNARSGFFFDLWTNGGPDWDRYDITAHQCERISQADLERERAELPDPIFRREYMGEFIDGIDAVFASDDTRACVDNTIAPMFLEAA